MAEPQVIHTLKSKREAIEASIIAYERHLAQARLDLAHINATIVLFEASPDSADTAPYSNFRRLFKRGEVAGICEAAIAAEGPLDTRELALRVIRARGMDEADPVLRRAIGFTVVQILSMRLRRGRIASAGKRKGVRVWSA